MGGYEIGLVTSHILALLVLPKHAALKVSPRIVAKSGKPRVPGRARVLSDSLQAQNGRFFL